MHKRLKTDKTVRLATMLVTESNDDGLNINSLPNEVILEIFHHLNQNQLGQIARVCRRWNMLTRSAVLWKKVNVQISPSHKSVTTITTSFINRLPSCVTSITLDFFRTHRELDFSKLCVKLKEKCPHLEILMIVYSKFSCSLFSIIDLCTQFLQDVKKIIFCYCIFPNNRLTGECNRLTGECNDISKIEMLGVFDCEAEYVTKTLNKPSFSRMPYLKELHLQGSYVGDSWFEDDVSFLNQLRVLNLGCSGITSKAFPAIQNHGVNIEELCMYLTGIKDQDLNLTNSVLSCLKTICLGDCYRVTCDGIVSLVQSCQSLQNVYVNEHIAELFAAHPFVVARKYKSGIVKAIACDPDHKSRNYFKEHAVNCTLK